MTIENRWYGQCLSVGNTGNNVPVEAKACNDTINQRFQISTIGDSLRINTMAGTLDAHAQNSNLVQWGWIGGDNQQWNYNGFTRPNDWEVLGHVPNTVDDDNRIRSERMVGSYEVGDQMCFRVQAIRGTERSAYSEIACANIAPLDGPDGPVIITLTAPQGVQVILKTYTEETNPDGRE